MRGFSEILGTLTFRSTAQKWPLHNREDSNDEQKEKKHTLLYFRAPFVSHFFSRSLFFSPFSRVCFARLPKIPRPRQGCLFGYGVVLRVCAIFVVVNRLHTLASDGTHPLFYSTKQPQNEKHFTLKFVAILRNTTQTWERFEFRPHTNTHTHTRIVPDCTLPNYSPNHTNNKASDEKHQIQPPSLRTSPSTQQLQPTSDNCYSPFCVRERLLDGRDA